jgi:AcrR family transcriptional regulator
MGPSDRNLRVDAARNRDQLLAAAEQLFAEQGPEATVADIARRAGVGKGTFFRHFATKDVLIAEVVSRNASSLVRAAERLQESADASEALLKFLGSVAEQRQQMDVSFLLNAAHDDARVAEVRTRLYSAIGLLVDRAKAQGSLRNDIGATDVILLMCAPAHVVEQLDAPNPGLWRRYLGIIFDGLRPEAAHPLPHPEPHALA